MDNHVHLVLVPKTQEGLAKAVAETKWMARILLLSHCPATFISCKAWCNSRRFEAKTGRAA